MSEFELFDDFQSDRPPTLEEDKPSTRRRRRSGGNDAFYNVVTVFFLIMTVVAGVVALLFTQEQFVYSSFNPWPPQPAAPTPTLFVLPSPTSTPVEPTTTPTVTPSPEPPTPTFTITLSPTPLDFTPSAEDEESGETEGDEEATPTPILNGGTVAIPTQSVYPFILQDDAVTYVENQNEEGCAWQSIVGQVMGLEGDPIIGLAVQVTGENFEQIEFTGSAPDFGASGYEVWLNTTPLEAEYELQLLNTTGQPLSEIIIVQTLSACERNVAIVNLIQDHAY